MYFHLNGKLLNHKSLMNKNLGKHLIKIINFKMKSYQKTYAKLQ